MYSKIAMSACRRVSHDRRQIISALSTGRSRFAAGAKLSGDLTVAGIMELSSHIDGKITANLIVIEADGSAIGELHADNVEVKCRLEGNIYSQDVKLRSGAKVSGTIFYQTLTIESGAEVN